MDFQKLVSILGLRKPFSIELKSKGHKKRDAVYWSMVSDKKLVSHLIYIYTKSMGRSLDTLIAHELIHAWQAENNIDEVHGPLFQRMAKVIEKEFGLTDIYIPNTDI